jgi:hypothetical protein
MTIADSTEAVADSTEAVFFKIAHIAEDIYF